MKNVEQCVILSAGRHLIASEHIREIWISPFLPNGIPNPMFEPEDRYRPSDGAPIMPQEVERLIAAERMEVI